MNRGPVLMIAVAVVWGAVSLVSMAYGVLLNWPDYVHTNYGFPLTYAVHTTSTFTGPADKWSVDLTAVVADLALWVAGFLVIVAVTVLSLGRSKVPAATPRQ